MTTTPRFQIPDRGSVSRSTAKPREIRRGSLLFRIFTQRRGKYVSHTLSYRLNGARQRVVRAKLPDVLREIDAAEIAIANGETALLDFTHTDRALLHRLKQLAAGCDVPLEILVAEAVAARKHASRANIVCKCCPEILDELIEAQTAAKAGDRWLDDLESRGRRLVNDFPGPLATVRGPDLLTWFRRLKLSDRSWNNYRTVLVALVKFAKAAKYVAPDWDELSAVKPFKIEKGEEELYTPEQMRSLLFTAEKFYPQHLPTLAIMGFAGCRHSELRDKTAALDWADVHATTIRIRDGVAKSNTGRRYVDMPPNLVQWLDAYRKPRGPVCEVMNLTNAFARLAEKAKVKWKANGLRNTYISTRCAITENIAKVAKEAGNSVREIEDSYRQEMTKEEAQRWFEIYPTKADVLPLFAYGKV